MVGPPQPSSLIGFPERRRRDTDNSPVRKHWVAFQNNDVVHPRPKSFVRTADETAVILRPRERRSTRLAEVGSHHDRDFAFFLPHRAMIPLPVVIAG